MQPAPPAPDGLVIQRFVRRLVAGPRAPLAELVRVASQLSGGAAVALTRDPAGTLSLAALAAADPGDQASLQGVAGDLDLSRDATDGLVAAMGAARPDLDVDELPPGWAEWTRQRMPLRSVVVTLSHGEDVIGWLWVGAHLSDAVVESLVDLGSVATMRHLLTQVADDRVGDALGLGLELARRSDELESANQTVDALAAAVGHDLREVFRELLGLTRLATEVDATADLREELLHRMRGDVERLGGMLGDVLEDVTEAQAVRRDVVAVDLNGVFAWVRRILAGRLEAAGATLVLGTLPTLRISPTVLRGVALELVRNAIEHGGRQIIVTVHAGRTGDVELVVQDDGPGIPAPDRELMFRPGHGTGGGAGMGLAQVRALLARVGGCISLEESAGGGLLARVVVPAGVITLD